MFDDDLVSLIGCGLGVEEVVGIGDKDPGLLLEERGVCVISQKLGGEADLGRAQKLGGGEANLGLFIIGGEKYEVAWGCGEADLGLTNGPNFPLGVRFCDGFSGKIVAEGTGRF